MLAAAALSLTACTDVLDKAPLDLMTEDMVWENESSAQAYLNRMWYATGRADYQNETWFSLYAGPLTPGTDIVSDNVYSRWNRGASPVRNDASWTENTDYGLFDNFIDIRRCNIAIDHIPNTSFNQQTKDDLMGQALFAKGLIYVTRAKSFGGYPIIERTLTPDDDLSLPRASIKETFDYGLKLIEESATLLNSTSLSGRPNKGAAYALLSEAYLNAYAWVNYAIQNDIQDQSTAGLDEYLQKAIESVNRLDEMGAYSLESSGTDWGNQFKNLSYASGTPKELILTQFTPPDIYNLMNDKMVEINCYLPTMQQDLLTDDVVNAYDGHPFPGYTTTSGWQSIAPNPDVVEETFYIIDDDGLARRWEESNRFKKYISTSGGTYSLNGQATADGINDISALMYGQRDQRFYQTIAYDGCTYFNNQFDSRVGGNMDPDSYKSLVNTQGAVTGYLFTKLVPQGRSWSGSDLSGFHRTCLRLSKCYLNAAEAYLLQGNAAMARTYINKTRTTHGALPALQTETGNTLWQIYLDERNAELMLENDRYFTLLRYGINRLNSGVIPQLNRGYMTKLQIAADGKSYKYVDLPFEAESNRLVFNTYRYLYPVAKKYIDANPNYTQNPRY